MIKRMILVTILVLSSVLLVGWMVPMPSYAGDWSVNIWGGNPYYQSPAPRYYYGYNPGYRQGYYPYYRPYNPVVRRDSYNTEGYAPDGTYHSENTVEDRRASYYSPGRNQAITPPQTSVQSWNYGPGQQTTRERTSWIGADGRPHSTTIDRNTNMDQWGNTHTDTHVTLKRMSTGNKANSTTPQSTTPQSTTPTSPATPAAPSSSTPSAPPAASAAPSASN